MLLALMYHRAGPGKHANLPSLFDQHFAYITERYPVVLPGNSLAKSKLNLCLTFDDATYDFYHYIFPLLKKYQLRALLGVTTRFILDSTTQPDDERLKVPYTLAMQEGIWENKAPLCTWEEIREMVDSGWVEIASHSYMHCNLTRQFVDLEREIVQSKQMLEEKLSKPITSFIYPFGKSSPTVHEKVSKHYRFAFRIGSAVNFGWGTNKKPLCRVIGDNLPHKAAPFTLGRRLGYLIKAFIA